MAKNNTIAHYIDDGYLLRYVNNKNKDIKTKDLVPLNFIQSSRVITESNHILKKYID